MQKKLTNISNSIKNSFRFLMNWQSDMRPLKIVLKKMLMKKQRANLHQKIQRLK